MMRPMQLSFTYAQVTSHSADLDPVKDLADGQQVQATRMSRRTVDQ
jgi:hypothetical protein